MLSRLSNQQGIPPREMDQGWVAPPQLPPPPSDSGGFPADRGDNVDCAVFAPPEVKPGEDALIQVFVYDTGNGTEAMARAKEFDEAAVRRGFTTLEMLVCQGQVLWFHLSLHGLKVKEATRELTWRGRTSSVQFGVTIPKNRLVGNLIETVLVSKNGLPVGRIDFKLSVVARRPHSSSNQAVCVGEGATRFRKAFVSYASKDRAEVLRRLQMLRPPLTDVQVFQDILDLEPGDTFEPLLYRRIDECDLFLLFWSNNSRNSDWVRREIEHARRRQGINGEPPPTILPVIIDGPPPPEPPPELAHLHFNDYLLYLAR